MVQIRGARTSPDEFAGPGVTVISPCLPEIPATLPSNLKTWVPGSARHIADHPPRAAIPERARPKHFRFRRAEFSLQIERLVSGRGRNIEDEIACGKLRRGRANGLPRCERADECKATN